MAVGSTARRPSTIRDVARLADVSRMTVSRVLSDPDLVKPETRARVQQAIASLGYVPDRAAGSLSTRRTGFVALVLPTLTNANFSMVAHGLTDVLRGEDYHLLVTYNDYSLAEEETQLRALLARRPEAVVLTGTTHSRGATALLANTTVPLIEVADSVSAPIQHAVGFSNEQVGRMAAQYLIGRGFTRIGAIASRPDGDLADHRGESRIRGFEAQLRLCGLSTGFVLRQGSVPVAFDHGATAIDALLDAHPEVEAVFCVSDLSAVGAIMECQRRGLAVPERLSVIGFGDFDIGRVINPPLTTIRVDFRDLGQRAGRLVLDLLNRPEAPESSAIEVEAVLIERGFGRSGAAVSDPLRTLPKAIIVMGVSGAGKSTIGRGLADALGYAFIEGDDLHPRENVERMAAGVPLDDEARRPWLLRVAGALDAVAARGGGIAACSALKRSYRELLRARLISPVAMVYPVVPVEALRRRMASRPGHYMPASLLDSQLATLEPPGDDERVVTVAADAPIDRIVADAIAGLQMIALAGD